jgi:hypothetical protein
MNNARYAREFQKEGFFDQNLAIIVMSNKSSYIRSDDKVTTVGWIFQGYTDGIRRIEGRYKHIRYETE